MPLLRLSLAAAASLLLSLASAPAQIPHLLEHTLPPPDGALQSGAQLGWSVAVDGGLTVVGAPLDDRAGTDAGVVKVFDSATGALLHVIPNPYPTGLNDQFGSTVAVSGTRVVIGMPGDDTFATDAGSAYVYDLSSGTPVILVSLSSPVLTAGDSFGSSVAISGTRVVVGAYLENTGAADAGSAYVYDLSSATPWVPTVTLHNPSPAASDQFGYSVAISGTRVVVGARADDTGATDAGSAYVYDLGGATPAVPVAVLNNPSPGPAAGDLFGHAVAISGTRVVVGASGDDTGQVDAGRAYVYDLSSATPAVPVASLNNPTPAIGDLFGTTVAISGTRVVVGAYRDDTTTTDAGSAYVYDLSSATPAVPVATLSNPTPATSDYYGWSVAISGTRVVVGAYGDNTGASRAGSAYLYDLSNAPPTVPMATLNDPGPAPADKFGWSVAISGTRVAVGASAEDTGAPNAGTVYVYDLGSGMPTVPAAVLHNPSPAASDNFGWSVAISGTRVVVGAPMDGTGAIGAGSAYVYDLSGATPTVPVATLNNPGPAANDQFGYAVAISGTRVVVGAYQDGTGAANAGSAYVYDLSSATPTTPVATLNNPSPAATDNFGWSVAISGTRAVVGAPNDDAGATDAGSAYVYDLGGSTPTAPVLTLNKSGPAALDRFGRSVAISGTRVVVGAYGDDTGATNAGSAYVYDLAGGAPAVPVVTLHNPTPTIEEYFGYSVAISGTRVAVSAYGDNSAAGTAYIYELSSPAPAAPAATLMNPAPATNDWFGSSVAIDGSTVVAGAPGDDTTLPDKGIAYIFAPADVAGPAGGTFAITPASPVQPATTVTATFAGWTDASLPLTYSVREGAAVLVSPGSSAAPTFTLPAGTHTLTGRIADSLGNFTDAGPVTVVVDGAPPVIATPGNLTAEATGANGTAVTFSVTATDALDPAPTLTVTPASGSLFPLGTTTVSISAQDAAGNVAAASFTVTVQDTTPPTVTPPGNVTAHATSPSGANVTYPAAAANDAVGVASVTYSQNSGTLFPVGTTTVTVTARDAANNTGTGQFTVTVTPLTSYEQWKYDHFGTTEETGGTGAAGDSDNDGVSNLLEFAFGTDPGSGAAGPGALSFAGTFAGGGVLTSRGQPTVAQESTATGVDYRALFVRRKDAASVGLTYTVQFASTLGTWVSSTVTPTVLASDGDYELVSVPYPLFVGGKKARFFHVSVALAP